MAGTLIRVRGTVGSRYADLARRFGVEASAEAIDRAFPAAFRAAPPMAFPEASPASVSLHERAVWQGIVRRVFAAVGLDGAFGEERFAAFFAALWDDFAGTEAWTVYPDVVPCLEALRARGCRAGIVTNFDGRVVRILEALDLARRFDAITRSSAVGAAKPDPAIFHHALHQHGARPEQALHVGDSPGDDVAGATAAGLLGVLVDRAGRHADPPAGVRITSLSELPRLM